MQKITYKRSPMVEGISPDPENYSDLRVLRSAAGWYIGTVYHNPDGYDEPGSRDSWDYYPTEQAAQEALDSGQWIQRDSP